MTELVDHPNGRSLQFGAVPIALIVIALAFVASTALSDGVAPATLPVFRETTLIQAVQPHGGDGVVIAGVTRGCAPTQTGPCNGSSLVVSRYTLNGLPDPTFGAANGATLVPLRETQFASVAGLAIDSQGRIVTASALSSGALSLFRFASNGRLDPSFGDSGEVRSEIFRTALRGHGLALDPEGRILVAGNTQDDKLAVARYLSDGKPDPSFGNNGSATIRADESDRVERAEAIAVTPGGGIILAGSSGVGFESRPMLAKLTAEGSPDTHFGGGDGAKAFEWLPGAYGYSSASEVL